ncbi:hypothetical protein SAMN05216168_1465 [Kosakonia radicincitans]|uniref:hypothetical protein n=1 Tax=Kosakonia radicincitans TaxID=283686 RepID=UPI0009A604D6|nr:hypothetical protein [Kosakonia radicincitans]SKC12285.1 hypothetical protein SAMN05216168_1465 [Kosakonia radicincitans]
MRVKKTTITVDNANTKKDNRAEQAKKYGPRLDTNLHADSQERLIEIAGWLNGKDYTHLTRGRGNVFRKVLGDVVNIFYIDYVYEPSSKESRLLKKMYLEFHKLKESLSEEEIITYLSERYPTPLAIGNHKKEISGKKWGHKQVDRLSDFRWLIQTMEKLDGKERG